MGLCQSDTRDQSKLTMKPLLTNPPIAEFPAEQPNHSKSNQSLSQDQIHIQESDYLLRTNINIHDINNSNNALENKHKEISPSLRPKETYMHLTLPPINQVFLNQSFSNQQPDFKANDKKIQNFMESITNNRDSVYHQRISQLMRANPLSQTNLNSNPMLNAGNEMSQKQFNEENNQITANENEESVKKTPVILQRMQTSKFLLESALNFKRTHDFFHDSISRFTINSNNLYDSKIFQNIVEEMEDLKEDVLYVITVISNPCKSNIKMQYYMEFMKKLEAFSNVKLITVEVTYNGLPFILTQPYYEPYNIQLRVQTPLNLKYNLMNFVISILPIEAEYIAYVKLYKDYLVVNKDSNIIGSSSTAIKNQKNQKGFSNYEKIVNLDKYSGTAWAAKKEFITSIGGFLDLCVTNENDEIISACFEGKIEEIIPENIFEFKEILKEWQKSIKNNNKNEEVRILNNVVKKFIEIEQNESPAQKNSIKNVGKKQEDKKKNYQRGDGWSLMSDNHFNPLRDLFRDERNFYQLKKEREKMFKNFKDYYMHSNDINF